MKIIEEGLIKNARHNSVEISGKDDSIGTGESETCMISVSFHCSEGAVEV